MSPKSLGVALGALAGGIALWVLLAVSIPLLCALRDTTSAGTGASLLYGLNPSQVSYHMPLSGLIEDILLYQAPPFAYKLALAAAGACSIVLLAALSCLLSSWEAALAALGLVLAALAWTFCWGAAAIDFVGWNVELVYSILILIVAGLLVWREEKPALRRTTALALSIGASLLCRSPLAFFPPVLALVERRGWRHRAVLLFVPYLFLLPWIRMNWAVHHRFIPFEYREADCNIVTGALGLVPTIEGDWKALVADPPDAERPGAVLRWAAEECLRHPFRTAAAYGRRVFYVLSLEPFLLLAALASLWTHRGDGRFKKLGLLGAYFIGIHCFMSVEEKYFIPVWLIAAALCAALVRGRAEIGRAPASAAVLTGLGGVLAASVVTLWAVSAYPGRARGQGENPWLSAEWGKAALDGGDTAAAAAHFSRALSLQPDNTLWRLNLAWALMLRGHPGPLLQFRWDGAPHYDSLAVRAHLLKAVAFGSVGQDARAREQLRLAEAAQVYGNITVRRVETDLERSVLEKLRAAGRAELESSFSELADYCRSRMVHGTMASL